MKLRDITLSALVATSLVAAPVMASAAPVEMSRSAATAEGEELGGRMGLGLPIAVAVLVAVFLIWLSDNDENPPVSP